MKPNILLGLFFGTLSGVCISITSVLAKEMDNINAAELNFFSSIGVLSCTFPAVILSKRKILLPWKTFVVVFIRSTAVTAFVTLKYMSFQYLPIGVASVIVYSDPVFVTIAGRMCLKEPCGIVQSVIIVFTVAGIVLTADIQSIFDDDTGVDSSKLVIGTAAACVSLIFGTAAWILLRKLKDIHSSVNMFHLGWISSIESMALYMVMGGYQSPECGLQTWYAVLLGLLNYLGQLFITLAVRRVFVGTVSTLRCAMVIFLNIMWQIFFYKEIPGVYNSVGMVLVLVSVLLIGFSKWLATLPPESSYSRKLDRISRVLNK